MKKDQQVIKAVMLGHAVGDALGVPVEFKTRSYLLQSPVTDMMGYGTYPVPAGAWSDDTSMSLAAMDSLANGKIDYFETMVNFKKWLEQGEYTPTGNVFDVGRTCFQAIRNFTYGVYNKENPSVEDIVSCGLVREFENGNGSLMRIHPFALMTWFDKRLTADYEDIIDKASALTHGHERSKLACKIYTEILFHLLEDPQKRSVMTALRKAKNKYRENTEYPHYTRLFDENFKSLSVGDIKSTGYVVDTLEAAIWCILTTDSYRECVLKAVNLGSDTDTVAAIAGGLAGALYGYDAIPQSWLDTLIKREYIEEMCERAKKNWHHHWMARLFDSRRSKV